MTILKMAALLETWINVLLEVFEVLIQSSGLKSFPTINATRNSSKNGDYVTTNGAWKTAFV